MDNKPWRTAQLSTRVERELVAYIEEVAKLNGLSTSKLVGMIVRFWAEQKGYKELVK